MRRGETNLPMLAVIAFGQILTVVALLGGGYLLLNRAPQPAPAPIVPSGDEHLRTISALAATNRDAAKQVASAYADFAAVLERTETQVATKEAFRAANQRFQAALWANDPSRPQIPGLAAPMNAYLLAKIGPESGAFDAAARATTVAALRDIVKALEG
jgi:hypothetical protein